MEVHHKCRLVDLCRVCGCKLHRGIKAKGRAVKPEPSYSCISYADKLLVAFDINVAVDAPEIHPQRFCTLCFNDLKSAPDLVVKLLSDISVRCPSCKKDVIARNYNTHECSPQINTQFKEAAEIINQLFQNTPSNTIQ